MTRASKILNEGSRDGVYCNPKNPDQEFKLTGKKWFEKDDNGKWTEVKDKQGQKYRSAGLHMALLHNKLKKK